MDEQLKQHITEYYRMVGMKSIRTIIAENIRREADKQGIDIKDLAKAVGRSQLYDVLAGRKGCTVDHIGRVAQFLYVAPHILLKEATQS